LYFDINDAVDILAHWLYSDAEITQNYKNQIISIKPKFRTFDFAIVDISGDQTKAICIHCDAKDSVFITLSDLYELPIYSKIIINDSNAIPTHQNLHPKIIKGARSKLDLAPANFARLLGYRASDEELIHLVLSWEIGEAAPNESAQMIIKYIHINQNIGFFNFMMDNLR